MPSAGTGSPTATRTTSSTAKVSMGTDSRLPSAPSRVAKAGRARASASTWALAMLRARCSNWRATSSKNTNITAASYQTWMPPCRVSQVLAAHASKVEPAIRTSIPSRRLRSSCHAPVMNGQPAQNTTGVATMKVIQRKKSRVGSGICPRVSRYSASANIIACIAPMPASPIRSRSRLRSRRRAASRASPVAR